METFSDWLMAELNERQWTQAELARRCGSTKATISRIINGERQIGTDVATAIAYALNLPPDEVFRQAGLLPPQPDIDPKLAEINYLLATLPPDLQEEALSYLRYLIEKEENKKARGNNLDFKKTLGTSNAN